MWDASRRARKNVAGRDTAPVAPRASLPVLLDIDGSFGRRMGEITAGRHDRRIEFAPAPVTHPDLLVCGRRSCADVRVDTAHSFEGPLSRATPRWRRQQ
jgi:hypothetical protein